MCCHVSTWAPGAYREHFYTQVKYLQFWKCFPSLKSPLMYNVEVRAVSVVKLFLMCLKFAKCKFDFFLLNFCFECESVIIPKYLNPCATESSPFYLTSGFWSLLADLERDSISAPPVISNRILGMMEITEHKTHTNTCPSCVSIGCHITQNALEL